LFNQLAVAEPLEITALYERRSWPTREWMPPPIVHSHLFFDEDSDAVAHDLIEAADLVVVSGYHSRRMRRVMDARQKARRPWVFWGERFGLRLPARIGWVYRRLALATLHRSNCPMWGIGSGAVRSYESEFGNQRLYLNVPYASDLGPFLSINRAWDTARPVRLLFSGSLSVRKGFDLLLNVMESLWGEGQNVDLWVVGDGPLRSSLEQLRLQFPHRLCHFGFKQMNELPSIYAEADILCAPSRHDGWGLVVVEALAAGMPVVSTTGTGAAVDAIDASCGWIIETGAELALLTALRTALVLPFADLRAMGQAGRGRAKRYDAPAGARIFTEAVGDTLDDFEWRKRFPPRVAVIRRGDSGNHSRETLA
jgi:glycosyltransferase involved in cell wall biosynthesis